MTIQVELSPETQMALAAQAARRNMDVPAYAAALLERAAQDEQAQPHRPVTRKSLAELFADSPFKGLDLDFERSPDSGRNIDL